MLLIDSTIYIDLLRRRQDPVEALRAWLMHGEILGCGVIRCEVLRSIVNAKVRERMHDFFETVTQVPISESTWDETARLAWSLDRGGLIIPLTDLVIACCAMRTGATVVTTDAHFRKVPKLKTIDELPGIK